MKLPQYLIRPSDSSFFELLENGLYAKSSDVGKDYLYESHNYKALIDLGFTEPSQDEIDDFESDREIEMFTSKSFQDNLQTEIKKSTWDLGLPMAYMNSLKQLVHHYKDGTIKIIKDLSGK
jgi:hypothetical protein